MKVSLHIYTEFSLEQKNNEREKKSGKAGIFFIKISYYPSSVWNQLLDYIRKVTNLIYFRNFLVSSYI